MTEKLSVDEKIAIFDENYGRISDEIAAAAKLSGRDASDITLLAATKTVEPEVINHAIECGLKFIGENRVQEFLSKRDYLLPCHRHLIGHLQTNKVKDIVGSVEMIQSVDSVKLAREIDKQCAAIGKTMPVLLEVNIGKEENKSGFFEEELLDKLKEISEFKNINISGLMAIPPICENKDTLLKYFCKMRKLFVEISDKNIYNTNMVYLSMGMSDDFSLAVSCGANMVRIGSALFGKRIYAK